MQSPQPMPTKLVHVLETVRRGLFDWWSVTVMAAGFFTAGVLLLLSCSKGEVGCDELLDRLVETKAAYHQSDSARDLGDWWDAAHDYCEQCLDWKLCDGDRPR